MDKLDDMDKSLAYFSPLPLGISRVRDAGPLWPNRYVGGSQIPVAQMRAMDLIFLKIHFCSVNFRKKLILNCKTMVDALLFTYVVVILYFRYPYSNDH